MFHAFLELILCNSTCLLAMLNYNLQEMKVCEPSTLRNFLNMCVMMKRPMIQLWNRKLFQNTSRSRHLPKLLWESNFSKKLSTNSDLKQQRDSKILICILPHIERH